MMKKIIFTLVFVMMHTIHTAETQIISGASYWIHTYGVDRGLFTYCNADGKPLETREFTISSEPFNPNSLLDPEAPFPKVYSCKLVKHHHAAQPQRDPTLSPTRIVFSGPQQINILELNFNPRTGRLLGHQANTTFDLSLPNGGNLKDIAKQLRLDLSALNETDFHKAVAAWHAEWRENSMQQCTIS